MKIGFIGLGNMGTAMANPIASNGYEAIGWEFDENVVDEINSKNLNSKFLPVIKLNPALKATNEFFRTRFSDDEIGVELGGILKNIYAIGLGMFDGKKQ